VGLSTTRLDVHWTPQPFCPQALAWSEPHGIICASLRLSARRRTDITAETAQCMVEDQVPLLTAGDPGNGFGFGFGIVRDPDAAKTPKALAVGDGLVSTDYILVDLRCACQ